jgi:hypothetical protein
MLTILLVLWLFINHISSFMVYQSKVRTRLQHTSALPCHQQSSSASSSYSQRLRQVSKIIKKSLILPFIMISPSFSAPASADSADAVTVSNAATKDPLTSTSTTITLPSGVKYSDAKLGDESSPEVSCVSDDVRG